MKHIVHFLYALILAGFCQGCTIFVPPAQTSAPQSQPSVTFSDPVLSQLRILLFGDISQRMAEETIQKLFYLDGQQVAPIDFYLMTPGGDLKAAMAIENAFGLIRSRVNTYALSECSSGGAMLLAAGTGKRAAFRGAMIVVHGMKVDRNLRKEHKDYIDGIQAYYMAFWQQRARLPAQWLPIPLNTLHSLTAEQALEYGLIDTIIERQPTIAELGGSPIGMQPSSEDTGRTPAPAGSGRRP